MADLVAKQNLKEAPFDRPVILRGDRVEVLSEREGPHCRLLTVKSQGGVIGEWADHVFRSRQ